MGVRPWDDCPTRARQKKCLCVFCLLVFLLPNKHKQIFPVTARAGEGSPDRVEGCLPTGGQGSKVYVLCAEPKEHKRFRPGTRPGGIRFPAGRIGERGDREIVYVPNVYVPFPAPKTTRSCLKSQIKKQCDLLSPRFCRVDLG